MNLEMKIFCGKVLLILFLILKILVVCRLNLHWFFIFIFLFLFFYYSYYSYFLFSLKKHKSLALKSQTTNFFDLKVLVLEGFSLSSQLAEALSSLLSGHPHLLLLEMKVFPFFKKKLTPHTKNSDILSKKKTKLVKYSTRNNNISTNDISEI